MRASRMKRASFAAFAESLDAIAGQRALRYSANVGAGAVAFTLPESTSMRHVTNAARASARVAA